MIYCSIDIETCGVGLNCDILEFGAVLDEIGNVEEKPLNTLPSFHCYFIKDIYQGEPFALSMHAEIFRRIAARGEAEYRKKYSYCSAERFGNNFKQFLINNGYIPDHDKVTINAAGKNFAAFDLQFLKAKTDIEKHVNIRSRILDPGILFVKSTDESIPGLSECKKRIGIDGNVAHNAIDDALDVIRLLRVAARKWTP